MPPADPSPSAPQIWRLQRLIEWLRTGRPLTTRLAAEQFEVSRRTIASDIETLRQMGVRIQYNARKGTYSLEDPFGTLPLVHLSRGDLAAFLVARYALDALGDSVHAEVLTAAVERIARHLPRSIQMESDALARTIRFDAGPRPAPPLEHLDHLNHAVSQRHAVQVRYASNSKGEETERVIHPHLVLSHQGRWYVVAWCRLRKGMRDFRIDRIRSLKMLPETFSVPSDFDLEAYLSASFGMHRGDEKVSVHVRFSPYQARWIREETWHPSQSLIEHPDGSLDLIIDVEGLQDVTRWILSYGAECEVLAPTELRERVGREVRHAAERYGDLREDGVGEGHGD